MPVSAAETANRTTALVEVLRYVPANTVPQLDQATELEPILDAAQIASIWQAGRAYVLGEIVQPATRNGFWYVCKVAGTSDAAEPVWPSTGNVPLQIGDGDDLLWETYGPEKSSLFDIHLAIHNAWNAKAAKATVYFSEGGVNLQQVYEHCQQQAAKFLPIQMF